MPSVNEALRANMARVRRATSKSPLKFACVMGREPALLINPNAKLIQEAKTEAGGGTVISGVCFQEDGRLVFETANDPPSALAKTIKGCISKHAGMTVSVEARKKGTGEEEDGEAEAEEAEANVLKTKVTNQVKKLQARVNELAKTAPDKVAPVRAKIAAAGVAFKKNDFEEAEGLLEEAEELM
jgi:hypothetical protein